MAPFRGGGKFQRHAVWLQPLQVFWCIKFGAPGFKQQRQQIFAVVAHHHADTGQLRRRCGRQRGQAARHRDLRGAIGPVQRTDALARVALGACRHCAGVEDDYLGVFRAGDDTMTGVA